MRINQQCAGCQSIFSVGAQQYATLRIAWCPACGHPNQKQPRKPGKIARPASAVVDALGQSVQNSVPTFSGKNRSGTHRKPKNNKTLEALRREVEEKGRVFLIDRDSVNSFDLQAVREANFPILGLGECGYRHQDALIGPEEAIKGIKTNYPVFILNGKQKASMRLKQPPFCCLHSNTIEYDLTIPIRLVRTENFLDSVLNLCLILGAKEVVNLTGTVADLEFKGLKIYDRPKTKEFENLLANEIPLWIERLSQKIVKTGKCFLLGAAPSLDKLPLQRLFGFTTLGTNSTFQKFPFLDALIFGDRYFIEHWVPEIKAWQEGRTEKPVLFWQEYGGESGLQRVFGYLKGQPSKVIRENISRRILPMFSLKHSIITAAINCAYWLGAKEIYLLGVELSLGHFFDEDNSLYESLGKATEAFPRADVIAPFIGKQREYLRKKGVLLATCWNGDCPLKGQIPYVSLENATDQKFLTHLI